MERVYIKDLHSHIEECVCIAGWVDGRRDHGKIIFVDLRDVSGKVQMVSVPANTGAYEIARILRAEWVLEITGMVNKRPETMTNPEEPHGDIEIEVESIQILSRAQELPFEKDTEMNLDTYLDYLPLTLRDKKHKSVFVVQSRVINAFRQFLLTEGFTEFQAPKIIGEDAEGGANSFSFEYFGHVAHLAQSPQLYKQIMVGVFERVFSTGNVYRAEKHSTSRHINEYTSLDFEMGFIKDHTDIMRLEERLLRYIMQELATSSQKEFALHNTEIFKMPEKIPIMKLREAQKIIKQEHGANCLQEADLEPQHERWMCEYAKKKYKSDFIFITHFPVSKRPFYTYEDENDPGYTKGFDLLFRGVEISTGAQRMHDYDALVASLQKKNLDPEKFSFYLQAFKYGMPPHGGLGFGLERFTAKLLGLDNVKRATLFPRDLNRIDNLLST